MKLHCSKILLFFFPLNILVTTYHAHNKNKPSITPHHTPIYTSRVLSEKDIESSIYDKDADIKSVKEIFDRKTSQRFEEYDERMKDKRQKRKEQRNKNIEQIIEKDKMDKSLTEKIEKGCLRCGCALGGVAASVGLFGGLGIYGSKTAALAAATDAGIKAGLKVGLDKVTEIVTQSVYFANPKIPPINVLETLTTGISGDNVTLHDIIKCISSNINGELYNRYEPFFQTVKTMAQQTLLVFNKGYNEQASAAVASAVEEGKAGVLTQAGNATSTLTTAITSTVVTIVVIVLILVIIYLILRYRRKKKMNKKAQYTKLLNE
ncbi:rifin PIR protein, putative [Plasmodium reichenowi]|uniref:Rifin PIR protein, putative n=1 Tax=Plasmodium reichenowi TaxID=5854 RepID=A0A2P9DSJ4_PLARE|nr:rifin PIR protein, putative [Plasmodium reichenowi]